MSRERVKHMSHQTISHRLEIGEEIGEKIGGKIGHYSVKKLSHSPTIKDYKNYFHTFEYIKLIEYNGIQ